MAEYVDVQKELVDKLRERGIYYHYKDRLELAWLKHHLKKIPGGELTLLINDLITLRIQGKEPEHKDGRYV